MPSPAPASERTELLILGLGNPLCSDDGAGVRVATAIAEGHVLPPGVRVLDGGTLGLQLLGELADAEIVLLVDAVRADQPPGTLLTLEGEEVAPAVRERLSVHQVGVADLLDGLELIGRRPRALRLLGIVPGSLELGVDCTPAVARALPALRDLVVEEARRLGFRLVPRAPERFENERSTRGGTDETSWRASEAKREARDGEACARRGDLGDRLALLGL